MAPSSEPNLPPEILADEIMKECYFITFSDDNEIWVYTEGIYGRHGEAVIKKVIEKAVPEATTHFTNEVVNHIRRRTYVERAKVGLADWYLIAVQNGVVDLRAGSFLPHDPKRILLNKLPVKYDPNANCRRFFDFLRKIQPDTDSRTKLLDHFAACLDRRPKKRRALLSIGERDTGKSTFLFVVEALLGKENVSNIPLQELCGDDKFAMARLYGKLANIYSELETIPLKQLGHFKALTGGDWISGQLKHKDSFDFLPCVKLFFSCNTPPDVKDVADEAFFSRWDVTYWEKRVDWKERDENLKWKLVQPEELSGILNVLIGVLRRQVRTGSFSFESSPSEVRDYWLFKSEPARTFLKSVVIRRTDAYVKRSGLFGKWEAWRIAGSFVQISPAKFNSLVGQLFSAAKTQKRINGKTTDVWLNLGWIKDDDQQQDLVSSGYTGDGVRDIRAFPGNLWQSLKYSSNEVLEKSADVADRDSQAAVFSAFRTLFPRDNSDRLVVPEVPPISGGHGADQKVTDATDDTALRARRDEGAGSSSGTIAPEKGRLPQAHIVTYNCKACGSVVGTLESAKYSLGKDDRGPYCREDFEKRRKREVDS
jgi:P4 family phage/plasmid primase-like protien